jgi:hypothetical protein
MCLILLKKNYILLKVLYLNPGGLTKRLECVMFIKVPSNRAKTGEAGRWYEVGEGRKVPEDVEPERARLLGAFLFLVFFFNQLWIKRTDKR